MVPLPPNSRRPMTSPHSSGTDQLKYRSHTGTILMTGHACFLQASCPHSRDRDVTDVRSAIAHGAGSCGTLRR